MSVDIEAIERDDSLDYVKILRALMEIPFSCGRNLLADFLTGSYKNKSITKHCLDQCITFGTLNWEKEDILSWIDKLISKKMIAQTAPDYNKFVKVLEITLKGRNEVISPSLNQKPVAIKDTEITENDKTLFSKYADFLEIFNDEQKKTIVCEASRVLCVAGAGSGKTTTLTKRIEHLIKHKGISEDKILAITFTRKAREEMQKRLSELGIGETKIHTFNSFCEGILRENGMRIYGRAVRVASFADKILAMNIALANQGVPLEDCIVEYFTPRQIENRTTNSLQASFMNDCFSVLDYYKTINKPIEDFSIHAQSKDRASAKMVYNTVKFLDQHLKTQGLRTYTDQIIDTLNFFKKYPSMIPEFDHVLIDEYQDVNAMQVQLLKILTKENLFAVGDPRQSIYGWRGSDINFIMNFELDWGEFEAIHLTKNYRSSKKIVDFMNLAITEMNLPNLLHHHEFDSNLDMKEHMSEQTERMSTLDKILSSSAPRHEIFVLARTNRELNDFSTILKEHNVPHIVRTDDFKTSTTQKDDHVLLATIHSVKGLEAEEVFVIGAGAKNFPTRAVDHPAIEMIKENYDKEAEELRLFYVAISRAKKKLMITYTEKPTKFLTDEMKKFLK